VFSYARAERHQLHAARIEWSSHPDMPPARSRGLARPKPGSWYAQHGRLPRAQDWEKAASGTLSRRTIRRRWGWNQLMAEASGERPSQLKDDQLAARERMLLSSLRPPETSLDPGQAVENGNALQLLMPPAEPTSATSAVGKEARKAAACLGECGIHDRT
jgi:hypothetical protein